MKYEVIGYELNVYYTSLKFKESEEGINQVEYTLFNSESGFG